MVCLGNICRSPMAEMVAEAMIAEAGLEREWSVESYGTAGYHRGEDADPRAIAALKRHGWPVTKHHARQISASDIPDLALVLCADRSNLHAVRRVARDGTDKVRLLRSFDVNASTFDDEVPDPWSGGEEDFDLSLRLIEAACRGLVDHLKSSRA